MGFVSATLNVDYCKEKPTGARRAAEETVVDN